MLNPAVLLFSCEKLINFFLQNNIKTFLSKEFWTGAKEFWTGLFKAGLQVSGQVFLVPRGARGLF